MELAIPDRLILRDQMLTLSAQLKPASRMNSLVMVLMAVVVWTGSNWRIVLGWLGVRLVILVITEWYRLRWEPGLIETGRADRARDITWALMLASGLHVGAGFLLFMDPAYPGSMIFMVTFAAGLSALAMPTMSVIRSVYLAYFGAMCGLLMLKLFLLEMYALSVLTAFFIAGCVRVSGVVHRAITDSITLHHRNEALLQEVRAAQQAEAKANRDKSRFLAAASHDLRQPLHAMGMFLHAMRERIREKENVAILDRIHQMYEVLDALFGALLEISRLDAGSVQPQLAHYRLSALLQPLLDEFEPEASAKGLQLKAQVDATPVITDRILFSRILRNLLSNAIRYTQAGEVRITARAEDGRIRLSVTDTGIGMDASEQSHVFDEYYQVHNVERDRNKGLGLGLAVVRRMAKLLGHTVSLQSAPGQGSTFSLDLPRGDAGQFVTEHHEPAVLPMQGLRVLVVDDERSNLDAMALLFANWNCEVLLADSLDEALRLLETEKQLPDLVISDYRLRDGKTGVELIRQLQQHYGDRPPGMLVSGDTDPRLLREITSQGLFLLHKPLKPAHLQKAIRQLLAN